MVEVRERPKCVVCDKIQVDVQYIGPVDHGKGRDIYIGFPVCYEHNVHDLVPDHYMFTDILVDIP